MTAYYEFILLIVFFAIAIILTVLSLVWRQISLAMAGAVIWVVLGLNRLLVSGDLTTLNGAVGLISLVMGVLTGILPYVTREKPPEQQELSRTELLDERLSKYGTGKNYKKNIPKPWFTDDD